MARDAGGCNGGKTLRRDFSLNGYGPLRCFGAQGLGRTGRRRRATKVIPLVHMGPYGWPDVKNDLGEVDLGTPPPQQ